MSGSSARIIRGVRFTSDRMPTGLDVGFCQRGCLYEGYVSRELGFASGHKFRIIATFLNARQNLPNHDFLAERIRGDTIPFSFPQRPEKSIEVLCEVLLQLRDG